MKAKKIVRVELKNPAIRRIRKNFRDVIELAVKQESDRLFVRSREYRKKSRKTTDSAEKGRLERKEDYFRRKSDRLDSLLSKSIIQCGLGGGCFSLSEATKHGRYPKNIPTNLDMAWMPSSGEWFCIKCCEILIEGYKLLRKERHPDHMSQLRDLGLL